MSTLAFVGYFMALGFTSNVVSGTGSGYNYGYVFDFEESVYTDMCIISGNIDTRKVILNDWNGNRKFLRGEKNEYNIILKCKEDDNIPFSIVTSQYKDNTKGIIRLDELIITIKYNENYSSQMGEDIIIFNANDVNSPLINENGEIIVINDDKEYEEFVRHDMKYRVSKDSFEMIFYQLQYDTNRNSYSSPIKLRFKVRVIGENNDSYNSYIIEATDELSNYVCGVCGSNPPNSGSKNY